MNDMKSAPRNGETVWLVDTEGFLKTCACKQVPGLESKTAWQYVSRNGDELAGHFFSDELFVGWLHLDDERVTALKFLEIEIDKFRRQIFTKEETACTKQLSV